MSKLKECADGPKVLDLFCGIGGLSLGFAEAGFNVNGIDINQEAGDVFSLNEIGQFTRRNLKGKNTFDGGFDVVVGGPPCEPWSSLNLSNKRKSHHPGYGCIKAFFQEVSRIRPKVFVMENVVGIEHALALTRNLEPLKEFYDISSRVVKYSDYGAAFARHRLFVAGVSLKLGTKAEDLIANIRRQRARTVRKAIEYLNGRMRNKRIDHVWPNLRTIKKYNKYYKKNKYGWYRLNWDQPAPSFGNIMKTYILHPKKPRAISVRETLQIVGFPRKFKFPDGIGMGAKYEMISNAVSPIFSLKLAKAIMKLICSTTATGY